MDPLDLIRTPLSWGLVLLGILFCAFNRDRIRKSLKQPIFRSRITTCQPEKAAPEYSEDAYYSIEPLHNFDVDKEEPLKIRPFKPKFHMTMAIENTTLSDLVAMDKTYRDRLKIRSELIQQERHEVLACNPRAVPAVLELYTWLTCTYLPTRFPLLFTPTGPHLQNNITGALLPLHMSNADAALQLLGENIDDEFLFLLPSDALEDKRKYRLEAFVNCFPSGFNTRAKLGLLLADIHTPVPGYAQKLEKSMDRFFAALPVGRIVKRCNWSISTNGQLFCLKGNHMSEAELAAKEKEEGGMEEIDLTKTVLRCERQTLHRLPESRALVFAFKTYLYPIQELRDEGSGEVLADAIDGLGLGSVPGMKVYKRQVVWGEKVKAFLRGEITA
ncbi:uncharacterized protein K460DRAFT_409396 [Cucurbitaria berberidis CBS 394.84]|uniref:HRQ family protein 2 n=1 Tax=Cucurbitaria berberidis CBS 394.84 TaxID=1168544 RepID=A0A9P4L541_9PLEO|nr:uncharacterized protein K460DRAFT_409396 [Cucurbitaria berberidis CBS 394.84]KAF1841957.1 hypothetical protein K460DRAFT_409396 [Cucurbitaria berberidis CBS 394.84]